MHDVAFPLDATVNRHHAGREDNAALLLVETWPDHQVGDAGFVLDGDEQHAFGGSRHLPHQHQPDGSSQRPSRACIASAQVTMRLPLNSARRKLTGWLRKVIPTWLLSSST